MVNALIIDDEIDICYLLSAILRQRNIEATYANTIADAAIKLKELSPSIIFLDNHLPDGMGVDFINGIKKAQPFAKIIMITAYDTANDRNKALDLGVDYFIAKPFSRDAIYQTIDQVVAN